MSQQRYWMLTIPQHGFTPYLPPQCSWIKGQLELGEGGFLHWQVICGFKRSVRLSAVRDCFGPYHAEATRSDAADSYVWKDQSSVDGTRFEIGKKCLKRNSPTDWEQIRDLARVGDFDAIPSDIFVRCYHQLRSISKDHCRPDAMERIVHVYWGASGTGKSRRAWELGGPDAYPKDPNTKFWDGYQGQSIVIMDEFRGKIDISHLLRWFDRYPCRVEIKGSSVPLKATTIYVTSNLNPRDWYPELDVDTYQALNRRINILHFDAL